MATPKKPTIQTGYAKQTLPPQITNSINTAKFNPRRNQLFGDLYTNNGRIGGDANYWTIQESDIYATYTVGGTLTFRAGKSGFSDLSAGFCFGIDNGVPKFLLGGSGGAGIAITNASLIGYKGTTKIWQLLQESTSNNIFTIWKQDFTPSYGNAISILDSSTDTNACFDIGGSGSGNAGKTLMYLNSAMTDLNSVFSSKVTSGAANAVGYFWNAGGTVDVIVLIQNDDDSGQGLFVYQNNASNTSVGISLQNKGTGAGLCLDQDGTARALEIDTETTTTNTINISATETTTGFIMNCTDADKLTTGGLLYLKSNSSDSSSRALMRLHNDNSSATGALCLNITQDSTADAIYILKNDASLCVEIAQTANSATECVGLSMNLANAGAGVEHAFQFAGSEYDSIGGGNTQVERVKVKTAGGTRYLYLYSD